MIREVHTVKILWDDFESDEITFFDAGAAVQFRDRKLKDPRVRSVKITTTKRELPNGIDRTRTA